MRAYTKLDIRQWIKERYEYTIRKNHIDRREGEGVNDFVMGGYNRIPTK